MKHHTLTLAVMACALIPAAPGWAQSGRVFQGEPAAMLPPAEAKAATLISLSGRPLVRDPAAQDALKANIARALAPNFELAGDVTFLNEAAEGGFLGKNKHQALLSVPVRYRFTATLDGDIKFGQWSMTKGAQMYRRFLPDGPGRLTGTTDWCGIGQELPAGEPAHSVTLCFSPGGNGKTMMSVTQPDRLEKPEAPALYAFPVAGGAKEIRTVTADIAMPAMTPVAQAPADMTARLVGYPTERGNGYVEWARSSTFDWQVKKGEATAWLGYSDDSMANHASRQDGYQVFRLAWADLVFKYQDKRLIYQGYIDLVAERPELAAAAQAFDAQLDGAPTQAGGAWSLGALDFDPDSLVLDADARTITLKAHLRQKVRLIEDLRASQMAHFEAGDIFYASQFTSSYYNGALFAEPGWCGQVHKTPMVGGFRLQTCFMTNQFTTAVLADYKDKWEMMGGSDLLRDAVDAYPAYLPPYEVVAGGPEDERDVVLRVSRYTKGKTRDGQVLDVAIVDIAVRRADGDKKQQSLAVPFDASGTAQVNLWTRRLVMTRDGDTGVTVRVEDGGDGQGLRGLM